MSRRPEPHQSALPGGLRARVPHPPRINPPANHHDGRQEDTPRGAPYVNSESGRCRSNACEQRETLNHVLQRCSAVHFARIARHDKVNRHLKEELEKHRLPVEGAPHVVTNGERYVPDFIVVQGDLAHVIETTVDWEYGDAMQRAYELKKSKYDKEDIKEKIQQMYRTSSVTVWPYVLGARGGWLSSNDAMLNEFKLPGTVRKKALDLVIRGSVKIHEEFMARVCPRRWSKQKEDERSPRECEPGGACGAATRDEVRLRA